MWPLLMIGLLFVFLCAIFITVKDSDSIFNTLHNQISENISRKDSVKTK